MADLKKTKGPGDPPKKIITANVSTYANSNKPTGKKGLAYDSNPKLVYGKNPEGTVTNTVQDLYKGTPRNTSTPKADSYKIRNKEEALGRTSGYLNRESKAYTLPMKEMKSNISKPKTLSYSSTPATKNNLASKISAAFKRAKKG